MKKSLALLCMLACFFGLTACGSASEKTPILTQEEAIEIGSYTAENIALIVAQGQKDSYAEDAVVSAGLDSWERALKDVGEYTGILETTATADDKQAVISVSMAGTSHNAVMEIIVSDAGYKSITTNVQYSLGETMTKAGLNTLVGMGTVFVVLVLISFIISAFNVIPKIQKSMEDKKNAKKDIKTEAIDNTIAQIVQKEEELSDDLELVAVIAAAIAASEGAASTDGYVVRSIRRRA